MIGQVVGGKYRVTALLGEGGMGTVYQAVNTATDKRVALKLIRTGELSQDPGIIARFEREVRAAGVIDTQHIVHVYDAGKDESTGSPFMAMELMTGEDLQQAAVRLGTLQPEVALKIVGQACVGLAKAHEAGVVHRDIKSANLFLAQRDEGEVVVKLLDFGIARVRRDALSGEEHRLTRTGALMGSPLYMSPEQARGRDLDARSDLWSLGIVLFEALSGRTPHDHARELGDLIFTICSEPPKSVRVFAPGVPPEVERIIDRALRIDPNERFQSAKDMLAAIRAVLPGASLSLRQEELAGGSTAARRVDSAFDATVASGSYPLPASLANPTAAVTAEAVTKPPMPVARAARFPWPWVGLGLAVCWGLGIAGWRALAARGGGAVAAATSEAEQTTAAPVVPPAPSTEPSAQAPEVASAPAAAPEISSEVSIEPAAAAVEVNGVSTPVQNGKVRLTGAPSSVHMLRIREGTRVTTVKVTLGPGGAVPSRAVLSAKDSDAPAKKTEAKPASTETKPQPRGFGESETFE